VGEGKGGKRQWEKKRNRRKRCDNEKTKKEVNKGEGGRGQLLSLQKKERRNSEDVSYTRKKEERVPLGNSRVKKVECGVEGGVGA